MRLDRVFWPLAFSSVLVILCMSGALIAFNIGFAAGIEKFLVGFELSLGSLLGSLATISASAGETNKRWIKSSASPDL